MAGCVYTRASYVANVISDIPNEGGSEVLWVKLSLHRLPRGFSTLVLGVLYHPPRANETTMLQYLQSYLELLETNCPNCGLIPAGDFNKLPIRHIPSQFQLQKIVEFNTRGTSKLDLILTNLSDLYDQPLNSLPLGLSDHLTIVALAKEFIVTNLRRQFVRDKTPSSIHRLRRSLCEVLWDLLVNSNYSCNQNLSNFYEHYKLRTRL